MPALVKPWRSPSTTERISQCNSECPRRGFDQAEEAGRSSIRTRPVKIRPVQEVLHEQAHTERPVVQTVQHNLAVERRPPWHFDIGREVIGLIMGVEIEGQFAAEYGTGKFVIDAAV